VISQKPDEALRILDPALDRIKDSANLWYWGGVCKHAMGDIAAASRRAREAYDLDPQNGDYERLLAGLQAA
jgi:tetratricopeptide (TPR) repeat protein